MKVLIHFGSVNFTLATLLFEMLGLIIAVCLDLS